MRRVLYIEFNEDGTVGGSHRAVYDLVRHLPQDRYQPVVLYYQENPYVARLRALGVEVLVVEAERARERRVNARGSYLRRRLENLRGIAWRARLLRRERIDIVHLQGTPFLGTDDWLPAARLAGARIVVTALSIIASRPGRVQRALARRLDHVIAISRSVEDTVRAAGVPPDRLSTVFLGVDFDDLRARVVTERASVRGALGVAPETVLVAMVGNVRRWKGQHVVVDALTRLTPAARDRMRLVFVGAASADDEAYAAELRAAIAANGLERVVQFLGARSDVSDLLNASEIAVHASIYPEPFGLVVPEAMALGNAVVAAAAGGPVEIVSPGTGLLFDTATPQALADHLAALIGDPRLRHQLRDAAIRRADAFSIARHVDGNVGVYDVVCGRTDAGRAA